MLYPTYHCENTNSNYQKLSTSFALLRYHDVAHQHSSLIPLPFIPTAPKNSGAWSLFHLELFRVSTKDLCITIAAITRSWRSFC